MAAKNLTDKTLKSLNPRKNAKGEKQRYEVKDGSRTGLSVRVGTNGTLTFLYRYQLDGKRSEG